MAWKYNLIANNDKLEGLEFTIYYVLVNFVVLVIILILAARRARIDSKKKGKDDTPGADESCPSAVMNCCGVFANDIIQRTYIYSAFLIHCWDSGSDLGVLVTWYRDEQYKYLAYLGTAVVMNYRIASAISFRNVGRTWRDVIFQFFDIQLFVDVFRSSVDVRPTDTLYWIRAMEAVLESAPQIMLQFVYLYKENDVFVYLSLLGSLGSVIFSLLHYDDVIFLFQGMKALFVFGIRFSFRLFEVLGRCMLLALIWRTWDHGLWFVAAILLSEFLFYTFLTQFRIMYWELVGFLVAMIDLNMTFEGREGAITRPLHKNICYRLIFKPVTKMFTAMTKEDEEYTMRMLSAELHGHARTVTNNPRSSQRKKLLIAPAHYVWRFLESMFQVFCICTYAILDPDVADQVFGEYWWVLMIATVSVIMTPMLYCVVRAFADDQRTLERNLIALVLEGGDCTEVARLVEAGAKLTQTDYRGNTVVHACVKVDNHDLLEKILVRSSAPLNRPNRDGYTPAMVAALEGSVACLGVLARHIDLANEIHGEKHGGLNESLAHLAAKKNQAGIIAFLGNHPSGNLHAVYRGNVTPAHIACIHGSSEVLHELGVRQMNLNVQVADGDTCLILAAQEGRIGCLRELNSFKVNLNRVGNLGHTAFFRAALHGHSFTMKWLASKGANVLQPDMYGVTVQRACFQVGEYGSLDTMAQLNISFAGCEDLINAIDKEKLTPAMWAALHNKPALLEHLAKHGAYLNNTNKYHEACVHLAATAGALPCLQVLANYHADMTLKNGENKTALQKASKNGRKECAEFLAKVTSKAM